jgi:hypothetical protein
MTSISNSVIGLRKKNEFMMPTNWTYDKGITNIERVIESKDSGSNRKVSQTQATVSQGRERLSILENEGGYGGGSIRANGEKRNGQNMMQAIDYGTSSKGVGFFNGKNPTASESGVDLARAAELSVRGTRKEGAKTSVYNVNKGESGVNKHHFAPTEKRGIKGAPSSSILGDSEVLNVKTVATRTYTSSIGKKNIHESSPFKFNPNMINTKNINVSANSGTKTLSKFELFRAKAGQTGQLTNRIRTSARARETFLPKYETEHVNIQLESKLKAKDVISNVSDPRIHVSTDIEEDFKLKVVRPMVEEKRTPSIIKDTSTRVNEYEIKNQPLRLSGYTVNAKASIPKF